MTGEHQRPVWQMVVVLVAAVFSMFFVGMTGVELINGEPLREAVFIGLTWGVFAAVAFPMLAVFDYVVMTVGSYFDTGGDPNA